MTQMGVILGTAAYMSPEQAKGRPVDRRTDIWAFGCVLYEMLTGKRAFEGDDVSDVLAHVLTKEPDWSALPATTPPLVRRLLMRCLAKAAKQRLHDCADGRFEIEEAIAGHGEAAGQSPDRSLRSTRRWASLALVAALALVTGFAFGTAVWRVPSAAPQVAQVVIDVGPAEEMGTGSVLDMLPGGSQTALAWSPTGRTLAFIGLRAGKRQVYLRDLDRGAARPLDGTENARVLAFSPDGEWLAFSANGTISKVRLAGGPAAKIRDDTGADGISWGSTRLVYADVNQLLEVSPAGGEPRVLTNSRFRLASPFLLPGDRAVLYTEHEKAWTSGDERVMVQSLRAGEAPKLLVRDAADARYLPTGHLAFLRQGTLFVVPFDIEALELRGSEVAVTKEVAQAVASWSSADLTLAGQVAVSPQGMLAYVTSPPTILPTSEPVVISRNGLVTPLAAPANAYRERIEVSPSGAILAVSVQTTRNIRLFLYDLTRGTLTAPFADSIDREAVRPIWSADGKIALQFIQGGSDQLAVFRPDSPVPPEVVGDSEGFAPSSWSRDSQHLVGWKNGEFWVYSPTDNGSKWASLTHASPWSFPEWSADGQWLAYASNASGRPEVYVEQYPRPGTPITISTHGGLAPAWNPKRQELFYVESHPEEEDDWRMMSVDMRSPMTPGKPLPLFPFSSKNLLLATCFPIRCYSVAPDGQKFFALRMLPRQPARVGQIHVILNWFEELRRLAPATR